MSTSDRENDIATNSDVDDDAIDEPTPLPKSQLFSVFLIQAAEPITAVVIYPFINQLVRETGITGGDETKTGYYAGFIESAFFLAECLTCVPWGYMSDKFGRRPILLCAPLGLAISMLAFGASTTFWPLVMSRCIQGVFNGNIGVARSMIAEMTDSTNRAGAYAFLPVVWTFGVTVGPILGGTFSNPAKHWPNSLGQIAYLRTHPYFLPCFMAALFAFLAFMNALVTLKETLPSVVAQKRLQRHQEVIAAEPGNTQKTRLLDQQQGEICNYGTSGTVTAQSEPQNPTKETKNNGIRAAITRPILLTLMNYIFLVFLDMCHFVLLPLMYSTPVEYGGLGLDPLRIGATLGIFGFINSMVQAKFFGSFVRRYGARKIYIVTSSIGLIGCFSVYPIMKFFAQRGHGVDGAVAVCIFIQLSFQMLISMSYGSFQVILIESIPEGGPMGTINGLAQMIASGLRTVAPTFASSLFSISMQKNLAGGNLVYYILLTLAFTGSRFSILMPHKPRTKQNSLSTTA